MGDGGGKEKEGKRKKGKMRSGGEKKDIPPARRGWKEEKKGDSRCDLQS